MTENEKAISVHRLRSSARVRQIELQAALNIVRGNLPDPQGENFFLLEKYDVPEWANGVKVESAGFLQFIVVATRNRGH